MTVPELEALKKQLVSQLLSGAQTIEFEGRRIERRSADEIRKILIYLDGEIANAGGISSMRRTRVAITCKNL